MIQQDLKEATQTPVSVSHRHSRTLSRPADYAGIGVHTGVQVHMRFLPAEEGSGIVFRRVDLPGQPIIPAGVEYVCDASRSTTIGVGSVKIHTVEHVLAAIKAYQIDNLVIELNGIEPPIGNGSSDVFVEMIEQAGITVQKGTVPVVKLNHPIYYSDKDIHMVAIPHTGYKISYTLNYPETPAIKSQYYSADISSELFKKEISPCRTFSLYEELSYLIDRGLIKGGSLDNAVVIKGDTVFSKGGLFFSDEMVRHKVLDVIGDLSLVGIDFHAHVIAIRAGHASNQAFAKLLLKALTMENP